MVNDAEKYKADDDQQRERIATKNSLESYAYSCKQTVEDDNMKMKISLDDKSIVVNKTKQVLDWIDVHQQDASKEEFEQKQKELQGVCSPILIKLHQPAGI